VIDGLFIDLVVVDGVFQEVQVLLRRYRRKERIGFCISQERLEALLLLRRRKEVSIEIGCISFGCAAEMVESLSSKLLVSSRKRNVEQSYLLLNIAFVLSFAYIKRVFLSSFRANLNATLIFTYL
jgi:hypothetical protein